MQIYLKAHQNLFLNLSPHLGHVLTSEMVYKDARLVAVWALSF